MVKQKVDRIYEVCIRPTAILRDKLGVDSLKMDIEWGTRSFLESVFKDISRIPIKIKKNGVIVGDLKDMSDSVEFGEMDEVCLMLSGDDVVELIASDRRIEVEKSLFNKLMEVQDFVYKGQHV
jgi:hypothetical protein